MKQIVLSVLLLSAAPVVGAPAPFQKADRRTDLQKLQGDWHAIRRTRHMKAHISGDRIHWEAEREETFRLFPGTEPKAIDVTRAGVGTFRGIYKLEGETITICTSSFPDDKRPPDFHGNSFFLEYTVLRRKAP
jgi:uncharacterized protein (TIGR03067 family)